jgi:hypothetical protein
MNKLTKKDLFGKKKKMNSTIQCQEQVWIEGIPRRLNRIP